MRLAWFAPMPPDDGSGPRDLSESAIPLVAERHQIEVFAGSDRDARAWPDWHVPVRSAYDFVWRALQRPYDLTVFQLSNAARHDYVWGYLWNFPGLVVLQDIHLHHARARILLDRVEPRLADYGAELHYNHGIDPDVTRAMATFSGPVLHVWPMRRAVADGARGIAVHNDVLADDLRRESPDVPISVIRPGIPDPGIRQELRNTGATRRIRQRFRLEDRVVLAVFGPLTRSRRIGTALEALASLRDSHPNLRLLLVGAETDEYDVRSDAREKGLLEHVILTGPVPDREMPAYMGAADVALSLVWPTAAETPGSWLSCLACGLPTIVTDVAHHADLPLIDPRGGTLHSAFGPAADPIAVLVDLLAERETLQLAIRRLTGDPALRARLGAAARGWWAARHTAQAMADDYLRVIEETARRSAPEVELPKHLRPDVFEHTRRLAAEAGGTLPPELAAPLMRTGEAASSGS